MGKSFLSNNQQTAVTQRKALGILNTGNSNVRGPVGKSNNVVLKQPQSTLKKPVVTIKNHSQTKLTASNTQKPVSRILNTYLTNDASESHQKDMYYLLVKLVTGRLEYF